MTLLAGCYVIRDKVLPVDLINSDLIDDIIPGSANERLNVLLLGIDARKGETMARTDSIILASVDQKSKQMSLLSIPRDTRVKIPGHGYDKINSASVYGGPELSMRAVSDLLGIPVKNYVLVNFNGFKDIVDALGGVTLDVEQDMRHWDPEDGGAYQINLKKGVQRLNGDKALQYVRYRTYPMADIDRTKAQQKFLVALAKEALQPSTIPKLPKLVTEINRYVKTNLSPNYLYTLASASRDLENGNMVAQTLPGRPVKINGGDYWGVNPAEARQVVAKLFNGETVTNIVLDTPLTGQNAGSAGSKTVSKPKTNEKTPVDVNENQQPAGTKTTPGQSGTKPADKKENDKTGQTTQNGSGSSSNPTGSGAVTITPITPEDTESGTKPGTSTGTNGTSDKDKKDSSATDAPPSTEGITREPGESTPIVNSGQAVENYTSIQRAKS